MKDWFTIEKIDNDTFAVSEYRHWEETHCWLLCGKERALLIDSGLGVCDIRSVIDALTDLPVTVVTTHVHWDHIGSHRSFDNIGVYEAEKEWLNGHFPLPLSAVRKNLAAKPCEFPEDFDIDRYEIFQGEPQFLLHDNDVIDLGNRTVQVIHTPGHSPGHCCFYEPERKYMYTGDLIYQGQLDAFYPTTDPKLFYESVKKLQTFDIEKVLPGHHSLNIPVSLIADIAAGFAKIEAAGKLAQGNGLFTFRGFQIMI